MSRRTLDFLVIGAGKSGTTTLWHALSSHPRIATPSDKERGFFNSDGRYAKGLDHFVDSAFPHAAPGDRLGTVTPGYMSGFPDRLETIVARMAADVPDVRLIALLRDPIDRAVSHFRNGVRNSRGSGGSFDTYLAKRGGPESDETHEVLRHGEYGRILARYLESFPREQLLVLFTEQLERDPAGLYRRVFEFLGVDAAHTPPHMDARLNRGGTRRRVSHDALHELQAKMDDLVFVGGDRELRDARRAFYWWTENIWITEPDDERKEISEPLRLQLERYYLEDGELLARIAGEDPPWLERYRRARKRAGTGQPRVRPPVPPGWTCASPDFVGVGAQRSGSTWWFDVLCAHPAITAPLSTRKELQFFGPFRAHPGMPEGLRELYAEHFPRPAGSITGEWSPGYMRTERVCALLHRAAPDARLLAILRDPLARLRSGVNRRVQKAHGAPLPEAQLAVEIEHSLYGMQLDQLLRLYDRERILLLQYERCVAEPEHEVRRTWAFLELEAAPVPREVVDATPNRRAYTHELDAATEARARGEIARDLERLRPYLPPEFDLSLWPSAVS